MPASTAYTFAAGVRGPIDETRTRVEAALRSEGFGILSEIDVAATLKAKLGIERDPYLILGACNPQLAHRALELVPSIGALLPCNVVLRNADAQGFTEVEIADPEVMLRIADAPAIAPIAAEAAGRLRRVLAAVSAAGDTQPADS